LPLASKGTGTLAVENISLTKIKFGIKNLKTQNTMKNEKTLPVYRSRKSGNSYILMKEEKGLSYISFPFLNLHGEQGSIPTENRKNDEFLGNVEIEDNSPDFFSLMSITGGK
jgi:hypothetical protein